MRKSRAGRIATVVAALIAAAAIVLPDVRAWAQEGDAQEGDAQEGDAQEGDTAEGDAAADAPVAPADPIPDDSPALRTWIDAVRRLDAVDYRATRAHYAVVGRREDVPGAIALIESSLEEGVSYEALRQRLEQWYDARLLDGSAHFAIGSRSTRLRVRPDSYMTERDGTEEVQTPEVAAVLSDPVYGAAVARVRWQGRTAPQRHPVFDPRVLLGLTGIERLLPLAEFAGGGGAGRFRRALADEELEFELDWSTVPGDPRPNPAELWRVTFEHGRPYAPVAVHREERRPGAWKRLQRRWFVPDRVAAPLPRLRVALDATERHDGSVRIRLEVLTVTDVVVHAPENLVPLRIQLPPDGQIHDTSFGNAAAFGYASMPAGWYRHWAEVLEPPAEFVGKLEALRASPLVGPPKVVPRTVAPVRPKGPRVTRALIRLDEIWPWIAGVIGIVVSCVVLNADPDRRPLRRSRAGAEAAIGPPPEDAGALVEEPPAQA